MPSSATVQALSLFNEAAMSTPHRLILSLAGILISGSVLAVQPPEPPQPAVAPAAASTRVNYSTNTGGEGYALVDGGKDSITMVGSNLDGEQVKRLKSSVKGSFLWFRDQGKAYLLQDPALLARIDAAWQPTQELGKQMSSLGKQMGAQGKSMGALGKQMSAQGRQQGDVGRQLGQASRRQALASSDSERAAADREVEKLQAKMESLQDQMEQHGDRLAAIHDRDAASMQALSQQMKENGKPMDALGKQMQALGKQQEQASKAADKATRAIIEEALRSGKARPV